MTMQAHALRYATQGWHVFPVNARGTVCPQTGVVIDKRPHLVHPSRPWTVRWGEVATTDVQKVVRWWDYSPEANIGIACGPSGLLVVDIDGGQAGLDNFDALCESLRLPVLEAWDTYTVRTGSGGYHLYYRWPVGVKASQASIAEHVDVRTNGGTRGGYVLGAGSVTDRGVYRMENPSAVRVVPPQLLEKCRDRPPIKPQREVPSGPRNWSGLYATVADAQEGNRNKALFWAARCMAEDGATEDEAQDLLGAAGQQAGLDPRETMASIRSGYRLQGVK